MPYVEYDEVEAICSNCQRTFRSEETLDTHRKESHPPALAPAALPGRSPSKGRSASRRSPPPKSH